MTIKSERFRYKIKLPKSKQLRLNISPIYVELLKLREGDIITIIMEKDFVDEKK